jgi:DNA-directed RNA polymerase subunit N (RpoN/RPB10)
MKAEKPLCKICSKPVEEDWEHYCKKCEKLVKRVKRILDLLDVHYHNEEWLT